MATICLPVPTDSKNSTFDYVNFYLFDDVTGLPFPLNLHPILSLIYLIFLVFILVEGTRLRLKIIAFLNSPESNIGPINFLIWLDQVHTKNLCLQRKMEVGAMSFCQLAILSNIF
jgi:hypothetical protein